MQKNLEFINLLEIPDENFGKYIIKPLNIGMGVSIGNLFRRILLTQMPRTNITGVRFAGINNEFSTIPGVREDVLEILLNLRQIILKGFKEEKTYVRIKITGPTVITSSCFQSVLPDEISLVNPNQYIATITTDSTLEFELKIESEKKSSLANNQAILESSDFLEIDKITSPIRQIFFDVYKKTETENQEELVLQIWTDGSITPLDAIITSTKIVQNLFTQITLKNLKVLK